MSRDQSLCQTPLPEHKQSTALQGACAVSPGAGRRGLADAALRAPNRDRCSCARCLLLKTMARMLWLEHRQHGGMIATRELQLLACSAPAVEDQGTHAMAPGQAHHVADVGVLAASSQAWEQYEHWRICRHLLLRQSVRLRPA